MKRHPQHPRGRSRYLLDRRRRRFAAIFLFSALLLQGGCSPSAQSRRDRLMDEIERKVPLPKGAGGLDAYARYYAFLPDGKVIARYVVPIRYERKPGETCEELDENFEGHEVPCAPPSTWPAEGVAGKRFWVANERSMPFMNDGGCNQLNIAFDPDTGKIEAFCNGSG